MVVMQDLGEAQHAEYDVTSYKAGLSGHHSSRLEIRGVPMPPPNTEVQRRLKVAKTLLLLSRGLGSKAAIPARSGAKLAF